MKVEIRKYERLLVTFFGLATILRYILQQLHLYEISTAGFDKYNRMHEHLQFDYFSNLLLPRIAVVVLILAIYFWINLFTIPQVLKEGYRSFSVYPWVLIQLLVLSYLLAIGVNIATYYARPAWNNYGEFALFALFRYNETPLTNLWAGFDRALILVTIYGVYAGIRELIIYRFQHSGTRSNYRILIANQMSASLGIFLLLPYLAAAFHVVDDNDFYRAYFVFIPTVIFVYFSNTYWLFPRYTNSWRSAFKFTWRLAISTFLYSIPIIILPNHGNVTPKMLLINFILQIVIVTPITWLLYQQRKDKIRELRGAEIALTKSTADLQFLRSQINPHFLFNILNTIYAMALVDGSKRTADAVQMLGDMMRFMLDDNHLDFVPFTNEISYLQNYIALQKLRIEDSDAIEITENINVDNRNHQIIPMLLIPFVENAFKHGIDINQKSWIIIALNCDQKGVSFNVRNSLHQKDLNDPERKHSGIGLQNVKERLNFFYNGRHRLTCEKTDKEFIIDLSIEPTTPKA